MIINNHLDFLAIKCMYSEIKNIKCMLLIFLWINQLRNNYRQAVNKITLKNFLSNFMVCKTVDAADDYAAACYLPM